MGYEIVKSVGIIKKQRGYLISLNSASSNWYPHKYSTWIFGYDYRTGTYPGSSTKDEQTLNEVPGFRTRQEALYEIVSMYWNGILQGGCNVYKEIAFNVDLISRYGINYDKFLKYDVEYTEKEKMARIKKYNMLQIENYIKNNKKGVFVIVFNETTANKGAYIVKANSRIYTYTQNLQNAKKFNSYGQANLFLHKKLHWGLSQFEIKEVV